MGKDSIKHLLFVLLPCLSYDEEENTFAYMMYGQLLVVSVPGQQVLKPYLLHAVLSNQSNVQFTTSKLPSRVTPNLFLF